MKLASYLSLKPKVIFTTVLILSFMTVVSFGSSPRPDARNVLVLEIRGMTYEMLERAYAPNIKYLIKNGFLGSMEARDPNEVPGSRQRVNIRRLLGRMVTCYDSLKVFQSSMNTVGVFSDTIRGPFSLQRKNFRSNESMVKDFINSSNGSNVQFSFLSFRTFTPKNNYLERDQINELTTIDSLIGIVFKSYQEKVKWEQTTVMVITDGTAAHKFQDNDIFKNTPVIIKGPGIPQIHDLNKVLSNAELMALAGSILGPVCHDSILPANRNFFSTLDTSGQEEAERVPFVNRPDILVYPVSNRNQINIELLADNEAASIYYTLDGTNPVTSGIEFKQLIPIKEAGVYTIKAATKLNENWSSTTTQIATLRNNLQSIEIDPSPDPKYTFNGADELVDGDTAALGFAAEKWLGFQGKDVNFIFNFGAKREIRNIDISALQDYDSWIFLPKKITVLVGDDRGQMVEVGSITHVSNKDDEKNIRKHFVFPITNEFIMGVNSNLIRKKKKKKSLAVKYLMVKVEASKTAPEWFTLPGAQLWFFTDEIKIE